MSTKTQANRNLRAVLLGAAATTALTLSGAAFGQNVETVTVTGTLIQGNTNLVSPVTVIDTTSLDQRGISSIQSALQMSLANNGPAVTNSWTANGNFAQGASGISLRGLSTNSTLVMFDGMRAAYYPLADDGIRNFVDTNTIPDDIVENIQILRDGASSSYGADAIAGVVNIVTKKEFQGFSARAEGGIADRGDAPSWKFSVTAGVGDLGKDHVNFYLSGSYYHSDILYAKARPYPFNTYDWTNVCATTTLYGLTCGSKNIWGTEDSRNPDGSYALDTRAEFLARPGVSNADGSFTAMAGSRYQNLNNDCGTDGGAKYTLTSADKAGAGAVNPDWVCQYDIQKDGGVIEPMITRFGISGHSAFVLPSGIDGYFEANFMQDAVGYPYNVAPGVYGAAPAGVYFPQFRTSGVGGTYNPAYAAGSETLYMPYWVCAERTNCSTQADKHVNPNLLALQAAGASWVGQTNAAGVPYSARIIGRDHYAQSFEETRDRTYRIAGELNGSLFSDWKWNIGVTAMHIDLRRDDRGFVFIQHLLDVVNDGTFNFVNPGQNSKATLDYLMPENITPASSDVAQAKASVTIPLYKLPGGDLTVVGGTSILYEAVDAPSANSDINGAAARYFVLNAFGTKGGRDAYAGFFEVNAPVLEELVLNASGRYDSYSSGQSSFSPKIGFWSKPLPELTLKGTYSEGFRIPSFAEANALPTTGYVANSSALFTNAYLAPYGCSTATFSTCPAYIKNGSYGLTTIANPHLKPENSRSWVMDLTYQPFDELTLNTTYYNIKKTGAIANLNCSPALKAYYGGSNAADPQCVVIPDSPDVNNPTLKPRALYLQAPLANQNAIRTAGWDFTVTYDTDIDGFERLVGVADTLGSIHMTSAANATFIQNLDTKFPDGTIERYDGTLGNNNLTAGTGTFKWRGTWQTTFTTDRVEFTSTMNWTSGYNVSAMDQGNGYRDCGMDDGTVPCRIPDYFTWDVNTQVKLNDNIKAYFTVINALDAMPPVDTIGTYGLTGYNVVQGGDGILGRYLKVGIKLDY